jgi:hypothetical protein
MTLMEEAQEEVKLDMTPMIDCVFLMIIFFVCIDFKILEAKLPAYLPKDKGSSNQQVDPQEQLSVKIINENAGTKEPRIPGHVGYNPNTKPPRMYPIRRVGHTVHWEVGPERINTLEELKDRLQRVYDNHSTWQPDKDHPGDTKPIPIVIEPYPGTYYDDVARTVDVVKACKFPEVNFGGGLGATKN